MSTKTPSEKFLEEYKALCEKHSYHICQTYPVIYGNDPDEEEYYSTFSVLPFETKSGKIIGINPITHEQHAELVKKVSQDEEESLEAMKASYERCGGKFDEEGNPIGFEDE